MTVREIKLCRGGACKLRRNERLTFAQAREKLREAVQQQFADDECMKAMTPEERSAEEEFLTDVWVDQLGYVEPVPPARGVWDRVRRWFLGAVA